MEKKSYRKPLLVTRVVSLGVFGNYNDAGIGGKDGDGNSVPHPFKHVTDRRFTLE